MGTPTGGSGTDTGQFSTDEWPDYTRPLTLNGWNYSEGDPINYADPSGHCRSKTNAPTDCQKFVAEVKQFISVAISQTKSVRWMGNSDIVAMLASYYSGIKLSVNVCGLELANPGFQILDPSFTEDRWKLPDPKAFQVFETPPVAGAEEVALQYGFRRIFYTNTHHYFAVFYSAWFYGSAIARSYNAAREADQYKRGENDYADSAADILVGEVAIRHVEQLKAASENRADFLTLLASYLATDACGKTLNEIYAEWVWPNPTVESALGPPPK